MINKDSYSRASQTLAAAITNSASKQTYYTIRLFVDRKRVPDALRAYAYFRWVDDCLDSGMFTASEREAFLERQQFLLDACYLGDMPGETCPEEIILVDLIRNNPDRSSGLGIYLRNMMAVMAFDVERRGRMISQAELSEYTRLLATAVTEALHYFIGHDCPSPRGDARYLAVRGAHIIHMLRDGQEDVQAGYFNIPSEYVQEHNLAFDRLDDPAFLPWIQSRVHLARSCFHTGRETIAQVKNLRCRLAGYAYVARFEWMLHAIERDNYRLRHAYPERKSLRTALWILGRTLFSALKLDGSVSNPARPPYNKSLSGKSNWINDEF